MSKNEQLSPNDSLTSDSDIGKYIDKSINNTYELMKNDLNNGTEKYPSQAEFQEKMAEFIEKWLSKNKQAYKRLFEIFDKPNFDTVFEKYNVNFDILCDLLATYLYGIWITSGYSDFSINDVFVLGKYDPENEQVVGTAILDIDDNGNISTQINLEGLLSHATFFKGSPKDLAFIYGLHEGDHINFQRTEGNLAGLPHVHKNYSLTDREFRAIAKELALGEFYLGENNPIIDSFIRPAFLEILAKRQEITSKI